MIINEKATCGAGNGKRFVQGKVTIEGYKYFKKALSNTQVSMNYAQVTQDFGFVPSMIVINYPVTNSANFISLYNASGFTTNENTKILWLEEFYELSGGAYVNEHGFCLPFDVFNNPSIDWIAYE